MKKFSAMLLAGLLTLWLLSGCSSGDDGVQEEPGLSDAQANELLNARGRGVQAAQNFDIAYLAYDTKLVTDSAGRELLLIPQGSQVPSGHENAVQVTVPVNRVMFASPTQIGFLELLENDRLFDSVAAVTEAPAQWTVPQVQTGLSNGQIQYIEPDSWLAGDTDGLLNAAPDLVFTDMSSEAGTALCGVLDSLGIPYAVVSEERETDTEAYLEWLKFFGAFFAMDDQAHEIYNRTIERLNATEFSSGAAGEKPVVAYGRVYGGVVYTQAGNSAVAHQLQKAGAVYALEELEGSGAVRMSLEDFMDECRDADILIYDQLPSNIPGLLTDEWEQFAEFKAYQNPRVYTLDSSYFMNCVNIDKKLLDLAAICYPNAAEYVLTLYQPLQKY